MISRSSLRLAAPALFGVLLGACAEDNGADYCKNHYAFHSDHLDSVASLTIETSDVGELDGALTIPRRVFGELPDSEITSIFAAAGNVVEIDATSPCQPEIVDHTVSSDEVTATIAADCGVENQIKRVDIRLLDRVGELDELVAVVTTPATEKRFGISRQCDAPMFRLD